MKTNKGKTDEQFFFSNFPHPRALPEGEGIEKQGIPMENQLPTAIQFELTEIKVKIEQGIEIYGALNSRLADLYQSVERQEKRIRRLERAIVELKGIK